jgi:prepilin-type N-terminal cleavage/methylation domain-containing protein
LASLAGQERGLLDRSGMEALRRRARPLARAKTAQGFSLVELLTVVAMIGVLASIAIGITPGIINSTKGQGGASEVSAALRRAREVSISRRRNVRVTFQAPNQLVVEQIGVPGGAVPEPAITPIETITLEGGVEYRRYAAVTDTPDLFGNAAAVQTPGPLPVMFTSEGMFTDANGDPTTATIQLGIRDEVSTATAVTILGATATIRQYRWNGSRWVE